MVLAFVITGSPPLVIDQGLARHSGTILVVSSRTLLDNVDVTVFSVSNEDSNTSEFKKHCHSLRVSYF